MHRLPLLVTALLIFVSVFNRPAHAQYSIEVYPDRSSFTSASTNLTTFDFEGIAANSGFKQFKSEGSLVAGGLEFRPGGAGGKFGPGWVTVVGPWYQAGPIYETTSGAKLIWAPPNQPGNVSLTVTLPSGTSAVATDLWTAQPFISTVDVTATTADGQSRSIEVSTPQRPASGFIGFTSDAQITTVRFTIPRGQTALILDNFTYGRAKTERTRSSASIEKPTNSSEPSKSGASSAPPESAPIAATRPKGSNPLASGTGGRIAYVRNSTEIRVIDPDGTGDRRLWTHPDLTPDIGIFELAWRPDGSELAFSSGHAAVASLYHSDIYTIKPEGSGLRKITNPPERSEYSRFPKGTVTVTIRNDQPASDTSGNFIVYVAGADEPQQIVLPAGTAKTLTFRSVADLGKDVQPVVAMYGKYRWYNPGTNVIAGRTVTAPTLSIGGEGYELLGAFRPTWRSDGSRISYRSGLCIVSSVPAAPLPGEYSFNPLFGGKNPMGTCAWDWGPTPSTSNQILYSENSSGDSSIYQLAEGGTHPGKKLATYSELEYQILSDLHWLPDASGFLYSTVNTMRDSANIFRYDFKTQRTTQITRLERDFAGIFSVSPDGRSIVFERCKAYDDDKDCDIWIVGADGNQPHLLVPNGRRPSWGK